MRDGGRRSTMASMPPHRAPALLIDVHAPAYDISNSHVVIVDAEPATVLAGVDRVRVGMPVPEPISLLAAAGSERVYATAWRGVKVVWNLRVTPGGESGAVLSATTRLVASDDAARERLLGSWGAVGPVTTAAAKRALAAIKRYAEDQQERAANGPVALRPVPPRRPALARAA
jgi:hypothetical protein